MSDGTLNDGGSQRILVIGGTGVIGAPIVRELDRAGFRVRVASRHAGEAQGRFGPRVELVSVDANHSSDLECALGGCRQALICVSDLRAPYLDLRVTRAVVELAPKLGLETIGLVSGTSVAEKRRFFPMVDAKYQAEEALKASGVPWIIFRPTWSMESLTRFVSPKGALVFGRQPAVIHPVAGVDIGRMVARAFELPEAAGHTFTIHGPEPYTVKQWLEQYCALVGPETQVKNVPFWMLSLIALFTHNTTLRAAIDLMKYFEHQPEYGDPTQANRLLGAPTVTLKEWVQNRRSSEERQAA